MSKQNSTSQSTCRHRRTPFFARSAGTSSRNNRFATIWIVLLTALFVGGCASNPKPNAPTSDPFENFNRKIFKFNNVADDYVLRPVARAYKRILPDPVETGILNIFENAQDVTSVVNNLLQGRPRRAGSDAGRVLINTTLGVLGIFDLATPAGYPKYAETFGQTFGVWGFSEGPYLVLPFFGPANGRTLAGRITQGFTTDGPANIRHDETRWSATVLSFVSFRASFLGASEVLDQAALDPYLFWRDVFVRTHRAQVNDLGGSAESEERGELDELDELDEIDQLDELDEIDELDRLDELDEIDELDRLDELEQSLQSS